VHESRRGADRLARDLDLAEALEDLFPDRARLHLREAMDHAAMGPWPKDVYRRAFGRSMRKEFASAIAPSSRLPEMYHMATRSSARMVSPRSSTSPVAVRAMCAAGDCQRMISETMFGIADGARVSFSYGSGCSFRASTPPVIELRVAS
jgi:hypothetical protein